MPTRLSLLAPAFALAAALLGGCSTGGAPQVTTSSPETAAPEVNAPSSVRIVLSTETVGILGAEDDELGSFSYDQSPTQVVDLLVEVLDEEPVSTMNDGDAEGTAYEWPGLTVHDVGATDASPRFWLEVSAPRIAGIRVETTDGYAVGDEIAVPETAGSLVGDDDVIALSEDADGRVLEVIADPVDKVVTELRVPAPRR